MTVCNAEAAFVLFNSVVSKFVIMVPAEEKLRSLRETYRPKRHPKHHDIGNKKHQAVC